MGAITRAAEGLDRRAFTVSDVLRMQEAGIFEEQERFELIEGEIVPMPARGHAHEWIKSALNLALARALPDHLWLGVATSIYLSEDTLVEPDFVIYPRGMILEKVKGSDIVLAIEVSATSLAYDREFKAALYARHKFKEYWVVDAVNREVCQFASPRGKSWRRRDKKKPDEALKHPALPGFSFRLSDY